jgi:hypothetical protein
MYLTTIVGDSSLIALDHGGHLLALIGMHNKHYFVVAHKLHSLWISCDTVVLQGAARPRLAKRHTQVEQETIDISIFTVLPASRP